MTEKTLSKIKQTQAFLDRDDVQKKFQELLGKRSGAFLTSVMSAISSNYLLKDADPKTVYTAAIVAATLDLPINPNLGFAYIVPYKNARTGAVEAQFQMWYKGFIQLAQRSGQFKTINAVPVYEGDEDDDIKRRLTAIIIPDPKSDNIIWYVGYFKLLNGFEKHLYMSEKSLKDHGAKFSSSYKKDNKDKTRKSLWNKDFDSMAIKTVLKLLLSKYAPLSVDMQTAIDVDQAVIRDENMEDIEYVDNQSEVIEAEVVVNEEYAQKRVDDANNCKTIEEVEQLRKENRVTDPTILSILEARKNEIKTK